MEKSKAQETSRLVSWAFLLQVSRAKIQRKGKRTEITDTMKNRWIIFGICLLVSISLSFTNAPDTTLMTPGPSIASAADGPLDRVGTQWSPYLEWTLENPSHTGNPYDLVATVTFFHEDSGETRTTEMFYDGGNTWKFRFTGTRTGTWSFTSSSNDPDLNGRSGTVTINPNPNPASPGFVTQFGNKWGRQGTGEAFVPQFVMYYGPQGYHNDPSEIDADIQTFVVDHGFTGFHTPVLCSWFDINDETCDQSDQDPDRRTFEALELLITKTYAAGGVVHIWMWGDSSRQQNPHSIPNGINGTVDRRLQRYIAARLGPLPGWTAGYGYDLWEWVNGNQLTQWHDYMQDHLGWQHYLGARSSKNSLSQISEAMDYSGYEQHKPDYDMYVETIERRPQKPSFSEDRFRIRNEGRSKDYNLEETRRGLWHSTMAGGVANIWGNLIGAGDAGNSEPYSNWQQLNTYARFFEDRFTKELMRCNELTNAICLRRPGNAHYIFYRENTNSIQLNLSGMSNAHKAVAVDTKKAYAEIDLGELSATDQTWTAPYNSDWAIAVGNFGSADEPNETPIATTTPQPTSTPEPSPSPSSTPTSEPPTPEPTTEPSPVSVTLGINAPASMKIGEMINVAVEARDVTGDGLYGIQFELNFDPDLIAVSNLQVSPDLSFVLLKKVDNTTGKIELVASREKDVPGLTGIVPLLTFDVTAGGIAGTTIFNFENEKISNPDAGAFNKTTLSHALSIEDENSPEPTDTPVPTDTPTNTPAPPNETPSPEPTDEPPTPEPTDDSGTAAVIFGQVILPGHFDNNWSNATVTVDDTGQEASTDAVGNYTIVNVTSGAHTSITAAAPGYLAAKCMEPAINAPETNLAPVTLLSGDVDGNNIVDVTDAAAVGLDFDKTGPDFISDINRDEVIDIFDLVLVSLNFGQETQIWNCLSQ